jgi:hypothetical protein
VRKQRLIPRRDAASRKELLQEIALCLAAHLLCRL